MLFFQEKTFPNTFKQDRVFGAKITRSSLNLGYSRKHSFNVYKKCKDLNTSKSTGPDNFTSLRNFCEKLGKEFNIATQLISSTTSMSLNNTAKVKEKNIFEQKDAALTPAFNQHPITPTNSYHLMTTKSLWQPSGKTLESRTKSNESIYFSPLDNENTDTGLNQTLHYQGKDKARVRWSKNITERTYVKKQNQYYETVKSEKLESTEASSSRCTSENEIRSEQSIKTSAKNRNPTGNPFYISSPRGVCRTSSNKCEREIRSIKPTFKSPTYNKMTTTTAEHLTGPHTEDISITLHKKILKWITLTPRRKIRPLKPDIII